MHVKGLRRHVALGVDVAVKRLPGRHAVDRSRCSRSRPAGRRAGDRGRWFRYRERFRAWIFKTGDAANQVRRRGILTTSARMSRICARTGSRPCEVSTTKSARLRFSASGSLPRQDGVERLLRHGAARQDALALSLRRRSTPPPPHRRVFRRRSRTATEYPSPRQAHRTLRHRQEISAGRRQHRVNDLLELLDGSWIVQHACGKFRPVDLAVGGGAGNAASIAGAASPS